MSATFQAFKKKWEASDFCRKDKDSCFKSLAKIQRIQSIAFHSCCQKGWDHVHVVMQTLVVTGGFLIMTLYKAIWAKYGRTIHHWEEALVTFFSSFFCIYLVYLCFNRKISTSKIW